MGTGAPVTVVPYGSSGRYVSDNVGHLTYYPDDGGPDYAATQEAVVLAELRGELAALRADLAPIIVACTSLMTLPKVAKQLMKNQQ